jgi:hypothetical protein
MYAIYTCSQSSNAGLPVAITNFIWRQIFGSGCPDSVQPFHTKYFKRAVDRNRFIWQRRRLSAVELKTKQIGYERKTSKY